MPIVDRTVENALVVHSFVKIKAGEVVWLVFVVVTHAKWRQASITPVRTVLEARARAKAFNGFVVTIEFAGRLPSLFWALIETDLLLSIAIIHAFGVQGQIT